MKNILSSHLRKLTNLNTSKLQDIPVIGSTSLGVGGLGVLGLKTPGVNGVSGSEGVKSSSDNKNIAIDSNSKDINAVSDAAATPTSAIKDNVPSSIPSSIPNIPIIVSNNSATLPQVSIAPSLTTPLASPVAPSLDPSVDPSKMPSFQLPNNAFFDSLGLAHAASNAER